MFGKSVTRTLVVSNPTGLHARPCLAIVTAVRGHNAKVKIRKGADEVDAGEMLQLMTLGAAQGTKLTLTATGPDARRVLDAIERLFTDHFGLD